MTEAKYGWGLPPDISTHGAAIDNLIIVLHVFMVALFVGWGIYLLYCLVRFRQRQGHKASYESAHSKFPKYLEVGVVLFEVFLLVGLSFPVWSKLKTDFPEENKATVVRVVAQQFAWNIHYPGLDGKFGPTKVELITGDNPIGVDRKDPAGRDDIISVNQFHFPVNKPVIVHLSTIDVIHSFSVPVLRVKQDAIPGLDIPMWFEATQTGQFDIQCAQLCGLGHSRMRGFVVIEEDEKYQAWLKEETSYLNLEEPAKTEAPSEPEGSPEAAKKG